jgi:hypothetical protein
VIPVSCTGGAAKEFAANRYESPFAELVAAEYLEREKHDELVEAEEAWEMLHEGAETDPIKVAKAIVSVVAAMCEYAVYMDQVKQLPVEGVQDVANRPPGLRELSNKSELVEYMKEFDGVVLINGHGSVGEYGDLEDVKWIVDNVVKDLDDRFGGPNWLVMYGGEPYSDTCITVSYPVRRFWEHGKKVLAVQCDFYGGYVLEPATKQQYEHLTDGALYQYETKWHYDKRIQKKAIQFGGYDKERNLIGGSAVWFSEECRAAGFPTCQVLIGGGPISEDEADYCYQQSIPIFYARTKKKNLRRDIHRHPADAYGQLELWANSKGLPRDTWHPRGPEDRSEH